MPEAAEPPVATPPPAKFAGLDAALDAVGTAVESAPPEPAKPAEPPVPPPSTAPAKPAKGPTALDDLMPRGPVKTSDSPTPPPKPAEEGVKTPKELRAAYEALKKERDEWKTKHAESEGRFTKFGTESQAKLDEAVKAARAETDAVRAKLDEATGQLRFHSYQSTDEFKDKYVRPLETAYKSASEAVQGMKIRLDENTVRDATTQDLAYIIGLPNSEARTRARELFGDDAGEILQHRRSILSLAEAQSAALKEWKDKGSKFEEEQQTAAKASREQAVQMFEGTMAEWRNARPELFGDDEKDPETTKAYRSAVALVDKAFRGAGIPEGLTPAQRAKEIIEAQGTVAAMAVAVSKAWRQNDSHLRRIAELEKKLKDFEDSEPVPEPDAKSKNGEPKTRKHVHAWDMIDEIK